MITADQIVIHGISDYYIQNDWMAQNKKNPGWRGALACAIHCITYTLPFLVLTRSWRALLIICVTHYIIDRTYLVAWLIWVKNLLTPAANRCSWAEAKKTMGFHPSRPPFISIWIGIIVDNLFHLVLNALAIQYL